MELDKSQKILMTILGVFSAFVFIMWFINIRNQLGYNRQPMQASGYDSEKAQTPEIDITTDTDGDGVSDWDEANIYKTSMYLEDTDGDGIPDGREINQKTDPNCPTGQQCGSEALSNIEAQGEQQIDMTADEIIPSSGAVLDASQAIQNLGDSDIMRIISGQASVAEIRQLFKQSGIPAEIVDSLSDDAIMTEYKKMASESNF